MLLNMSSGIASSTEGSFYATIFLKLMERPHFVFQHELLAAHGLSLPRVFPVPGGHHDYSNSNTVLLGEIAEKVTSKPYARLLNQRLFRPLGMKRSFLAQRGVLRVPYAQRYQELNAGQFLKTNWGISQAWAAGGVASTLDDGRRWVAALGTGQGDTAGSFRDNPFDRA